MSLRLVTLGDLQAISGDTLHNSLRKQRLRSAVLVYIAVQGKCTREQLVNVLWPDRDVVRARHALTQTLYELKRELGDLWLDLTGDVCALRPAVQVDAILFEHAVEAGRFEEALRYYGGAFLAGTSLADTKDFEDWAERCSGRLARLHRRARKEVVSAALARDDVENALRAATGWVELEPLDDEAHHRLIECLALSGRRADALQHYERFRTMLADELDIEPLDETVQLIEDLRAARSSTAAPSQQPAVWTDRTSAQHDAIAVLPFEHIGPASDDAYIGDGIAEELINALGSLGDVRVAARTSSFAFRGRNADAREIGRALSVRWLLSGSVRRTGERVRITAQLVKADDGYQLWSETFDRETNDLIAMEEDISRAVVQSLKLRLRLGEEPVLRNQTGNPVAFEAYLRGRYHWNQRDLRGFELAIAQYKRALEVDPDYALAHCGLADAYGALAHFQYRNPRDVMPLALEAAERALELAPQLSEAHTSYAHVVETESFDWAQTEAVYLTAIRLNARSGVARVWYADLLTALGRHEESAAQMRAAELLEPLSVPFKFQKGAQVYRRRDYPAAEQCLAELLEVHPYYFPAYVMLALVYCVTQRPQEAIRLVEAGIQRLGRVPPLVGTLGIALAYAGQRAQALAARDELEEQARKHYVLTLYRVALYAALGMKDEGFEWLDRACEERHTLVRFIGVEPIFDPLRDDPRMQTVLNRLGLAAEVPTLLTAR